MFGTLNEKLEKIVGSIRGKAIISEDDLDSTLREIRVAFLEADVALSVVKSFVENIKWGVESKVFFQAFFRAAFLEETMKFLVLVIYCLHLDKFDEPMDALVYGVAASLGFAAYENWQYVMNAYSVQGVEFAKDVAFIRSYTAVPLHALCGVFMGFFLMDATFGKDDVRPNLFLSLFFPVCLHGLYNYILMSENFSIQYFDILSSSL